MKDNVLRKGMVCAIVVLFIGVSIIPLTGSKIVSKTVEKPSILTYSGDTLYVGGTGPNNYTSIQDAIDDANPGDTIYVYNGSYHESVIIYKTINLIGEDKNNTIIYPSDSLDNVIRISADNSYVSGFTLKNSDTRAGVLIDASNYNTIANNRMFNNNQGIKLFESDYNSISGNLFQSNNHGIYLSRSVENTVTNNTILSNIQDGIIAGSSNIFYHNVIFDLVSSSSSNIWDNGYPSGGNYWDGYQGTDGNGDGIGDTPYVINSNNIDHYPLGFFHPYANFTYTVEDLTVHFNGSMSTDPNPGGYLWAHNWNFGDGTQFNGNQSIINHTYNEYGTYLVSLLVIDNGGETGYVSKLVSTGNRPPNDTSNPNPSDNATEVATNMILSWSGGDPDAGDTVTYDVYFGTTNPPSKVVWNQSGNTYNPGILDFLTTYYWQIVTWDNNNASTTGSIWKFTTCNNPVYEPTNPDPYDGEIEVDLNANLSWTGGGTPSTTVTYDVYFGTTNPPPQVAWDQPETTYNPGPMDYNAHYYWQIVGRDNQGNFTSGPIWDFFTETATFMSIIPSNITVETDETFYVDVYIDPCEPIIGANFDYLYFDPDILQANSVISHGYFPGAYPAWPDIDNVNGAIRDCYEFIMGPGSVSYPGVWVTIEFTAQHQVGTSLLDIEGADCWGSSVIVNDGIVNVEAGSNSPPYEPSNPNPYDGEIYVDVDRDLSWTGDDPDPNDILTYDVYFGTSSNPPLVSSGQSSRSYDPGTMNYNTHYYWKIVSWDLFGESTTGPIWSFTTDSVNNPPYEPSNPDPYNGETNVDVDHDLNWTGGDPDIGDTVTYDVHFGTTSPPPLVVTGQPETTYDPGTMASNTQYFWQIVIWDNHGASNTSLIWNFRTVNNPPYEPSNPNPYDGETDVDADTDLYWTGGDPDPGDTVTYDIYFGTTNPPPKILSNQSETTYDPGIMDGWKDYYWKIVAWDSLGESTMGPIWTFRTLDNIAPECRNQGQNKAYVLPGENISLFAQVKDNVALSWAWLETNETGEWQNYPSDWYDFDWEFRKKININNPVPDYQMSITVYKEDGYDDISNGIVDCEGHCNDDFRDIRFVDMTNTIVLPYWIEENGTSDDDHWAKIWVKISGNDCFYMYYGNPDVLIPGSNGTATFQYFDHWIGGTWDDWKYDYIHNDYRNWWLKTEEFNEYRELRVIGNILNWWKSPYNDHTVLGWTKDKSSKVYDVDHVLIYFDHSDANGVNNTHIFVKLHLGKDGNTYTTSLKTFPKPSSTDNLYLKLTYLSDVVSYEIINKDTGTVLVNDSINNSSKIPALDNTKYFYHMACDCGGGWHSWLSPTYLKWGNKQANGGMEWKTDYWFIRNYNTLEPSWSSIENEKNLDSMMVYGSPLKMQENNEWQWSNFTWQNPEIPNGTTVDWRIYYSDINGNINCNDIMSFRIMETPPEINNVMLTSSNPLDTEPGFGWENFTCTVTDDTGVHTVKIVITYPYGTISEHPMTHILGTDVYYYHTTFTDAGYYRYSIWANDTEGNNATSSSQVFVLPMNEDVDMDGCVTDADLIFPYPPPGGWYGPPGWMRYDVNNNGHFPDLGDILQIVLHFGECLPVPPWMIPPEITNITLTTSDPLDTIIGWEHFTCTVTDIDGIGEVKLILVGDTTAEYPMTHGGGDNYYCNITIPTADEYTYHIWAKDISDNEITSTPQQFNLSTNWDVDMNGQAYFEDLVAILMVYGETGPPGWVREDVDNNGQVYFDDLVAVAMHYGEEW